MKNRVSKLASVALTVAAMAFVVACGDDESPTLSIDPQVAGIVFTAGGTNATVAGGGDAISTTFTVTTNQGDFKVTPSQSWVKVLNKTTTSFTLNAYELSEPAPREPAEVTISAGNATPVKITVNQLGANPTVVVSPVHKSLFFTADGKTLISSTTGQIIEDAEFLVDTNADSWTVTSSQQNSWLKAAKTGNKFILTAEANTKEEAPEPATVTVSAPNASDVILNVTQMAYVPNLRFGKPTLSGELKKVALKNVNLKIPYNGAAGHESFTVSVQVMGDAAKGINSVQNHPVSITAAGNGEISIPLTGTPVKGGTVVFAFTASYQPTLNISSLLATVDAFPATWMLPFKMTYNAAVTAGGYYDVTDEYAAIDGWAHLGEKQWWIRSTDSISVLRGSRAATASQLYMSYSTYTAGAVDPDRIIMYGLMRNDYWLLEIPTSGIEAGSMLKIEGYMRSNTNGPRDYLFQYSTDKATWRDINPQNDGTIIRTIQLVTDVPLHVIQEFPVVTDIPEGMFYIRFLVNTTYRTNVSGGNTTTAGTAWITRPLFATDAEKLPIMSVSRL